MCKKKDDDIFFLYIDALDHKGHELGPDSDDFKLVLKQIDEKLKYLYTELNNPTECNILFIGDHGMSTVKSNIDFISSAKKVQKTLNIQSKDLHIFCDSTLGKFG